MNRTDFELIATAISAANPCEEDAVAVSAELIRRIEMFNRSFRRDYFMEACKLSAEERRAVAVYLGETRRDPQ